MKKTIYDQRYAMLITALRQRRLDLGLHQDELGKTLGVSRNWVSKVERREIRLDVLQYVRLCEALELSPRLAIERLIVEEDKHVTEQ